MKQQGFRQISIWVPDTKSAKFRKECRRQSRLASAANQSAQLDDLSTLPLDPWKAGLEARRHRDDSGAGGLWEASAGLDHPGGCLQRYSR
jgi:hypothetical protein